jgi:hypothetical protein
MNAHVQIACEEIAQRAQAVVKCSICRNYYISAGDDDAEAMAYAMATNECKRGAFRTSTLEETRGVMAAVLRNANYRCPSCG